MAAFCEAGLVGLVGTGTNKQLLKNEQDDRARILVFARGQMTKRFYTEAAARFYRPLFNQLRDTGCVFHRSIGSYRPIA
jgi:hypothetical protein